ncbi:Acetyl-S-ACP:malonate ACP transferase [Fundidesulfovibrio magnetotacticus]|uniref:Acetyl-S-ACP:malonate ACP transferase n=1 Tax=Fundidesulfovibrio magnetotacticus TaxID=2730080 RepID=A0A6V8LQY4_9BACT|nr:malonate decarboxylase subunit alpha [Fundidesulfovibrio magnetotacticus]GFK92971.1 Acetyl-S-ACP:malonate ACP transferase [Fundidesulfovibrio magnetotacticus]
MVTDARFSTRMRARARKLEAASGVARGQFVPPGDVVRLLEAVIAPGDRVCIEGDNQKQADFLAQCLARVNPDRVNGLRMTQSSVILPEHLDVFERGIAATLDFAYAGPQGERLFRMVDEKRLTIGAIHTYVELYARSYTDLCPDVCLLAAAQADRAGNVYTGFSTEETPALIEATAFKDGVSVVQVNEVVDKLPRVDIPSDWVDFIVESPRPFYIEPLFTKDPARISDVQVLMGMMAMKAIYARYLPRTINHGVGFNTAAIELLLPTYGQELGLKGRACRFWALNPHPTMIPAIEEGFAEIVYPVGGEVGMEAYVNNKPDIFPVGPGGTMRSNRFFSQMSGHFADIFVGATLQIDTQANSSTVTSGRLVGYGGAPNFGCESRGRRHASPAWLAAGAEGYAGAAMPRGRKLVVQIVETFRGRMLPTFVERLDAWDFQEKGFFETPPVMIYGDDITHIVTEEGVANLLLCRTPQEREQAVRGVAGFTPVGLARDKAMVDRLRERKAVQWACDLDIKESRATRDMLAARSIKDLVDWSGGLYDPPSRFRNW